MRSLLVSSLLALFCLCAAAQNVRLTEFMVTNTGGITDEDGTPQAWIEIWNPNAGAAALITGSKIDNGTEQWTFPAFSIMPDERVIIWASGKNRVVSTAPLHTSFTLPVSGSLILRRSDNSIMSRIDYPAQAANVSYGRDEWDAAGTAVQVGFYHNPTPGERNNYSGPGVAGKVVITPGSSAFEGTLPVTIALEQPDPDTVIRFTTNGTAPTASSTIFPGTYNVTTTMRLRARAFKAGLLPGEIESGNYLQVKPATTPADHTLNFSSAIPIIVISNFNGGTPPADGDQTASIWVWMPKAPDNRARFTNPPDFAGRAVIDRRGSSTLGNPKHNLNLEIRKARDDDEQDYALLGMPEHSDWVLHAPYDFDRALIRNPWILALSNIIGRYAPRNRMAEVFIDTTGGYLTYSGGGTGDYYGVYNVIEKIRRGGDRVDVRRLDTYDNDNVSKTGGYIWKIDRLDAGDTGFSAGGQAWAYYTPKEIEIKSPQRDPQEQYLTSYLNSTNSALQSATWNNPVTGYAAWLDVPAAIDHHLLNVWPFNLDTLRLSGYWHKDRGGKLVVGPIWDYDRSVDSTDGRDDNPNVWRSTVSDFGTDFFNYPWWNRMFADIDFYQKYIDRWQELRRGPFSPAAVNALLDQLNNETGAEAVARDLARWSRTKRNWTSPFTGTAYTGQTAEIQRMKDWLQQRANFMDSQWVGPVTASLPEGQITPGQTVTLTGPASSVIYYTLNGADPRPAGGSGTVGAGVLTYSGPITLNATTRLRARAYKASHTALTGANNPPLVSRWSGLTNVLYSTDTAAAEGNLVITEINYHPADPTPAELAQNAFLGDNDFEFIELRNISEGTINLAGCQFTDGVTFSFTGDAAVSLPPGGYVVVCANTAGYAVRYGATGTVTGPFTGSLSNGGETLRLVAANGSLIQEITWDDAWWPETDGPGKSLVVYNPRASQGYGEVTNWRPSASSGGSPGAGEPNLPPTITGSDQIDAVVSGTVLPVIVTDDGQPENSGNVAVGWSQVSGPGTVQFTPPDAAGATAVFSLPGVYSLRLGATDTVLTTQRDFVVTAHDTYSAWQARTPGIGPADEDTDGDGLTNYAEFSLLTNPLLPDAAAAVSYVREPGGLAVTFRRQTGPASPAVAVQVSGSLQDFLPPAAGTFTETILADDGLTQTVQVLLHNSPALQRLFVRLHVSGS
jgi:hypothetical protein